MHPGQTFPNEFECAILERIARDEPSLRGPFTSLRVLSREFTGVGSFTRFLSNDKEGSSRQMGLQNLIHIPGVPNGLGAVLFCKGGSPECLELFTYGDDRWDGLYEGFFFAEEV